MNSMVIIILLLSFIFYCYSFLTRTNYDYYKTRYKFYLYDIEEKNQGGRKEFRELLKISRTNRNYTIAIETLEASLRKNEKLTPAAWTSAIQIYGEAKQFSKALNMLSYMKQQGIKPNEMHYGALLQACKISGLIDFAIELFNRMEYEKVPRNTVIYNTMISSLGENEQFEQVIELLNRMTNEGIQKDVKTYSSAITACGKVGRFERAIDLYHQMETENIKPNTITLNAVLTACIQGRQWEKALKLFEEANKKSIYRDAVSYSNIIIGLGDSKQFEKAREIFISMEGKVPRDTGTYNAMMTTCKKTGHWQYALELLNEMMSSGKIFPDNKSFATVITCCGNAGKWEEAMKTYLKMDEFGITKDKVVFNSIINALQTAGQWQQAVNILQAMNVTIPVSIASINPSEIFAQTQEIYSEALNEGLLKHWIEEPKVTKRKHYEIKSRSLNVTGNDNVTLDVVSKLDITNKVIDLHGFPLPVAQAAIDRIFQEFLKSDENKFNKDITVITGKGNHLNTSGTRGVLRVEIEQYIQRYIEPRGCLELEIPESNQGMIIIKKESIKKWINAKMQSKN